MAMAMEMEMVTTIHNLPTISQTMVIAEIMATMAVVSTGIQAVDHKMISSLNLMHLSSSLSNQIISTFHRRKIVQMEVAMAISIHKPDIDTKAAAWQQH